MKIKVLLNLGEGLPQYKEDEVVPDVEDAVGNFLIAKGWAQQVDANQPATKSGPGPAKSEPPPGPGSLDEDAFNKLRRKI